MLRLAASDSPMPAFSARGVLAWFCWTLRVPGDYKSLGGYGVKPPDLKSYQANALPKAAVQ